MEHLYVQFKHFQRPLFSTYLAQLKVHLGMLKVTTGGTLMVRRLTSRVQVQGVACGGAGV